MFNDPVVLHELCISAFEDLIVVITSFAIREAGLRCFFHAAKSYDLDGPAESLVK